MPKSSDFYLAKAREAKLNVRQGKGDHFIIEAPVGRGYIVVPKRKDLATGTEHAIRKWLIRAGVVFVISVVGYMYYF
jgi:hypothetical protein